MRIKQNQYFLLLTLKEKLWKNHIKCGYIQIKQHSKVKYLGCLLDETMTGEAKALNVAKKINNKLKFFNRQNSFLHQQWGAYSIIH